jgi:hypothetical protein
MIVMGLGKFIAGLGAMKHILKEASFQTEARENPDKAVDMLIEFNENPKLIEYARHLSKPGENEWLLNTFQYTRQALQYAKGTFPCSYDGKLSKHVM